VFDVNLDGLLRDEEAVRNVTIPVPAGDVPEDLDLTIGQGFITEMFSELGGRPIGQPLAYARGTVPIFSENSGPGGVDCRFRKVRDKMCALWRMRTDEYDKLSRWAPCWRAC
jgi:hypothetical protein